MEDFPWTFDQFQRYAVLREFIEIFYPDYLDPREQKIKILDIGGLSPDRQGREFWLPVKRVFSGPSFAIDINFCAEKGFIQGDGAKLPFRDDVFDVAAALDVLEHVPPEKRDEFLTEMCRVTRLSVVVSAPFRDAKIEETEALLRAQIEKLHGVKHRQLLEHRMFGLPEISSVSEALGKQMPAGVGFYFGALDNWLFFQTLRNVFLLKKNAWKIQELLDRWLVQRAHHPAKEFSPPFSRHFWVYSKTLDQKTLESGVEKIKAALRRTPTTEGAYKEAVAFNKEVTDFFCRERVSAIVVTSGDGKHLTECLNHVLTQRVDFDLEVCVFDIEGNLEKEKKIKSLYPAVKYLPAEKGEKAPNAFLRVFAQMIGDFILLLADDVFLPADSVESFYQRLKNSHKLGPLSPRIVCKRWFTPVWMGKRYSPAKIAAGRVAKPSRRLKGKKTSWIFSPCLFFRKEALYERKLRSLPLTRRNIFLWEKEKKWPTSPLCLGTVVYKK